jgi:selenium metabolism protein YedF
MSKVIDARGWECPRPVLETKKALQTENVITVIVDNRAARENVTRLADKSGCRVRVEEKDDGVYLHMEKSGDATAQEKTAQQPEMESYITYTSGKIALFIGSDTVGSGSDELGGILMRGLMHTLTEVEPKPDIIALMNNGVKLAISDSPVLDDLKTLADGGTEILVCGTCLNYFQLTDSIAVGQISNAYTIAETLLQAGKVVRL